VGIILNNQAKLISNIIYYISGNHSIMHHGTISCVFKVLPVWYVDALRYRLLIIKISNYSNNFLNEYLVDNSCTWDPDNCILASLNESMRTLSNAPPQPQ